MKSIKIKIFKIIQPADNSSILSKMFDLVIVTLILINTVTIIAATFSLSALKIRIFLIIEIVSVIIFSVEYILRLWTADLLYPEKKTVHCTYKIVLFSDGYCRFISNITILHTVSITH